MSQWILRVDGKVIARQTARPLTQDELSYPLEQARRQSFDVAISRKLGDSMKLPKKSEDPEE